jgi:hypothetical protein
MSGRLKDTVLKQHEHKIQDSYGSYSLNAKKKLIKRTDYSKVVQKVFLEIINKMTETGYNFIMPFALGSIYIQKRRIKIDTSKDEHHFRHSIRRHPVNRLATKKLWETNPEAKARKQLVRFTNEHTEGYYFKYKWTKTRAVKGITMWKFSPSIVVAKKKLGKVIKSGKNINEYYI